jgi:hypothetical protein
MAAGNFAFVGYAKLAPTAKSTVSLIEKTQGVDYSRVRDLTVPEYFSL